MTQGGLGRKQGELGRVWGGPGRMPCLGRVGDCGSCDCMYGLCSWEGSRHVQQTVDATAMWRPQLAHNPKWFAPLNP